MKKLVLLLLLLALTACRHNVNTSNPKVIYANTILAAADADDAFSIALKAANSGIEQLKGTEPEYYAGTKAYLVRLAKLNDKVIAAIRLAEAGDTTADWRGAMAALAAEAAKTDPTVFGFKNANSQATAKIIFASLSLALTSLNQSFVQGGK